MRVPTFYRTRDLAALVEGRRGRAASPPRKPRGLTAGQRACLEALAAAGVEGATAEELADATGAAFATTAQRLAVFETKRLARKDAGKPALWFATNGGQT